MWTPIPIHLGIDLNVRPGIVSPMSPTSSSTYLLGSSKIYPGCKPTSPWCATSSNLFFLRFDTTVQKLSIHNASAVNYFIKQIQRDPEPGDGSDLFADYLNKLKELEL